MEDKNSGRDSSRPSHEVKSEWQAKLLTDPTSFRYFAPFVARERTVSQAADEVGCKLDTMLYRVRQFLGAGLLEVTRLKKRAGRPIKHYRSTHNAYFIPFEVTPYADREAQLRESVRAQEDLIVNSLVRNFQSGAVGRRLFRDDRGEIAWLGAETSQDKRDFKDLIEWRRKSETYDLPVAETFWDELLLTDAEARDLLQSLYALWQTNKYGDDEMRKPYLLQIAIAPLEST